MTIMTNWGESASPYPFSQKNLLLKAEKMTVTMRVSQRRVIFESIVKVL